MKKERVKNAINAAFRVVLITLGALLVINAIAAAGFSSINMGIIMPFVIGLPLLILGVFYRPITGLFDKGWFGKLIKWGMIACYGLFTLVFLTTTILILTAASTEPPTEPDAVIVLGAGIRGSSPSRTLAYRLDKSIEVLKSCGEDTVIIVSGGRGGDEMMTEASVMKAYLISHGVDEHRIIEENESASTDENFIFSKAIIEERFGTEAKLAFVTSDFHVFRAGRIAARHGVNAAGIAAKNFEPLVINCYLRECAAIVQYFLTGRL